jgi:hypothetical protein
LHVLEQQAASVLVVDVTAGLVVDDVGGVRVAMRGNSRAARQ